MMRVQVALNATVVDYNAITCDLPFRQVSPNVCQMRSICPSDIVANLFGRLWHTLIQMWKYRKTDTFESSSIRHATSPMIRYIM